MKPPTSPNDAFTIDFVSEGFSEALAQVIHALDGTMKLVRARGQSYAHKWMSDGDGKGLVKTWVHVGGKENGVTWDLCEWHVDDEWFEDGVKREGAPTTFKNGCL